MITFSCRTSTAAQLRHLEKFLKANRIVLEKLTPERQDLFLNMCACVSHLASKRAIEFFLKVFRILESLDPRIDPRLVHRGAVILAAKNWAMAEPYFAALTSLPDDDLAEHWILMADRLSSRDIDCAVTFLKLTPPAVEKFGAAGLLSWAEEAILALRSHSGMSGPAKAYLEESVEDRCATSREQWRHYLTQAVRIAGRAPKAAESFIRLGSRVCLLLNEEETVRWVSQGLRECPGDAELLSYFSGVSSKALENRDGLASGIVLKDKLGTLALICEAFVGATVRIRSNSALLGVKGFIGGPATDGKFVYLPDSTPSFSLLKLMALHQTALMSFNERLTSGDYSPWILHADADELLFSKLPGLRREADELTRTDDSLSARVVMPWWGEIFPELVAETDHLLKRAQSEFEDETPIPPELLEAILASALSEGDRRFDAVLARMREIMSFLDFESPDPDEIAQCFGTFWTKEWDCDLSDYKMDWCLVRRRGLDEEPNNFASEVKDRLGGVINLIRRQFQRLKPERFRKFRAQPYGDEIDLDALVEAIVEMRSGSFISDNVYIRRDKKVRDVAVLFLMDLSGSTEEQTGGRRIIDIEKEALLLMAEALDSLGDPFAVYGFSSEGRFRVDMYAVKNFNEEYGDVVRYRLGNLQPDKLTRLGAVVRHGIHILDSTKALVKLMIILTDGRPYDLEYGRLDYAIADTGKALKEARMKKIHPFIITTDKSGADYLKQMCRHTQSIIIPKPELLPTALPRLYKRLTA